MEMARSSSQPTARMPLSGYPRGRASGSLIFGTFGAAFLLLLVAATPASAQRLLRGRIISAESRSPMTDATVDAIDTLRRVVLTVRSDSAGRFDLPFREDPGSFQIRIRRIGIAPTLTDPLRFDGRDTVEVDLLVDERPAVLDEVAVRSDVPSPLNAQRLQDAYARGWRVIAPERVARHRENSTGLEQLLRAVTLANVSISANCLRSHVTNGCLTVFIDDAYFGQTNFSMINPKDVEFIAVIGPTEATTRYGNRAQYGVLMIYTRRYEGRRR